MEKILIGLGMEDAEKLLSEAIKRNNPNNIVCNDVIIHKGREHILDKIKNNNPTVVILRESLKGNDDILQTIYLIRKHFNVRIIFIAKNRKPGDKLLATLVGYSVYDILMGSSIPIEGIAKLVGKPNTLQDVYHLLPKPSDDDYDELLFETEDNKQEKELEEEEIRIRNPFGIIKRDKSNKVEEKVIDGETEEDNLDIEDIFKNAKPTKTKKEPKKLFGKDIEEYKDILINEDDEEIKNYDKIEEDSNIEKKSHKVKKSIFNKKKNREEKIIEKEKEELKAIIKEGSSNLDEQLKRFEEEMILDKEKLNKELEENHSDEKREEMRNLDKELKIIRKLKKQREKERKKREKEELAIIERQRKLEEEEKLDQQKKEKEAVDFERKIRERELDIKEEYAKRSGAVINGSITSTIWNKSKRFFIFMSVLLVGGLILNLIVNKAKGVDPTTTTIEYVFFIINLVKIISSFLKQVFIAIVDISKEIYFKINNS